ncbi:MAG TPA: hypothetical protein VGU43_00805 [Thermoplasmata archaeon]|nr:hypothetical protein [Thermoplasmata archaeon]
MSAHDAARPNLPPLPSNDRWRAVYTRRYELNAPAEYARHWVLEHGIGPTSAPPSPRIRQSIDRLGPDSAIVRLDFVDGSSRTDLWAFSDPGEVTVTKRLDERGRTELWSRERYRFTGAGAASLLEISAARYPVTTKARLALRLSLRTPTRPEADERAMCREIEHDYQRAAASGTTV